MNCAIKQRDDRRWLLELARSHQQLFSKARQDRLQKSLAACLQRDVQLAIEIESEHVDSTPAELQRINAANRQAAAVDTIEADPNVTALRETFGATINTVRPLDS
jgi:hypothetical protein